MQNILYTLTIVFIFMGCAKEIATQNELLIKKLESKENLDEFERMDLHDAKQFDNSSTYINIPYCKIN